MAAELKDKQKKPWREFEKLVAQIEEILAPAGAEIKSPDRIRDLVTGRMREVDASIRFRVGSVPILITIECRRRGAIQDDTWIEQLATKRAKIGAAKTIAVTASDFTASAIKTAVQNNIELRRIRDIRGEDISDWTQHFEFSLTLRHWSNPSVKFHCNISPDLVTEWDKSLDWNNTEILFLKETNTPITLPQLMDAVLKDQEWLSDELLEGDTPQRLDVKPFTINPACYIETPYGKVDVMGVEVSANFQKETHTMPMESCVEYSGPDGSILQLAEWKITDSKGQTFVMTAVPDSGGLQVLGESTVTQAKAS
jgi:hypothetical protein